MTLISRLSFFLMFFNKLSKKMFYWYIVTGDPLFPCWDLPNGCFFDFMKKMWYLCSRKKEKY